MKISETTKEGLSVIYKKLAVLTGITDSPSTEAIALTSEMLKKHYPYLEGTHIIEAAELYAAGSIVGCDHYNKFTPAFIGKLMAAMKERLKADGRLMSTIDQERQFQVHTTNVEPGDLPIEYENDGSFRWGHYLNDLFLKFKSGKLQLITAFIPVNCYHWMVYKGHLKPDSWLLYSQKASEFLSKKRRPVIGEFANMQSLAISVGNHENEAKKMAVLEYLSKKLNATVLQ